jgi:hypothetical protein
MRDVEANRGWEEMSVTYAGVETDGLCVDTSAGELDQLLEFNG